MPTLRCRQAYVGDLLQRGVRPLGLPLGNARDERAAVDALAAGEIQAGVGVGRGGPRAVG